MKNIGNTKEGNYLVELNQDEFREFNRLHHAVTGHTEFDYFRLDITREIDFDFSNVFHVIRVFYLAQFKVNEFQVFLDEIKSVLDSSYAKEKRTFADG